MENLAPPPEGAERMLEELLTNVYRALEFRNESVMYDRLAVNVTGEQLSETYLELHSALELENRGGRARVDELEILSIDEMTATGGGAFRVRARWQAGGSVSHFGHTHYRQNVHEAWLELAPVEGAWKINDIEVLAEQRIL